ncbi:MAG: hydrogenase maturation nickel metallochaperone HypA [Candidatus Altiarchaeota archaeon]|nr:hydrogenase maturation nickel metallochaperone HypA [Candidatus Altiarchaeota archaeon]
MHEFSIAEDILEVALDEAEKHKASRIKHISVEVGGLMMANLEQLDFALRSLSVGTLAEDMEVDLKTVPGRFKCDNNHVNEVSIEEDDLYLALASLRCPECGSPLRVLSGKECVLKRIIAE